LLSTIFSANDQEIYIYFQFESIFNLAFLKSIITVAVIALTIIIVYSVIGAFLAASSSLCFIFCDYVCMRLGCPLSLTYIWCSTACIVLQRSRWSSVRSLAEWQRASLTDKLAAGKLTYVTLNTRLDHPLCFFSIRSLYVTYYVTYTQYAQFCQLGLQSVLHTNVPKHLT